VPAFSRFFFRISTDYDVVSASWLCYAGFSIGARRLLNRTNLIIAVSAEVDLFFVNIVGASL
jgi:hypothetical protein